MHETNYGKYAVPELLLRLVELNSRLKAEGLLMYGDLLGLYFALEPVEARYLNTPVDVIPFARPGGDGIHFGFLTDFDTLASLDDAYIVRVEPMNFDDPVKIVARNLGDFVGLMCGYAYAVELLDMTSDDSAIAKCLADSKDYLEEHQEVLAVCAEELEPMFTRIESLGPYFEKLQALRSAQVVVETDDGIGVVKTGNVECGQHDKFALERDSQPDLNAVKRYFEQVPIEYKLSFVRDAQSYGILFNEYNLKEWVVEELRRLGFETEALRLQVS